MKKGANLLQFTDQGMALGQFESVSGNGSRTNFLTIPLGPSLTFFKSIALIRPRVVDNIMGLYSFANAGGENTIKFGSLTIPKHLLSKRANACTWNPKGRINFNQTELSVNNIQYQGEQCPDVFWETCLENLMGVGRQILDMRGTAEANTIFNQLVANVYLALGTSYYDLNEFGNHGAITYSDTNNFYKVEDDEWDDFTDQMIASTGYMTLIDGLKDDGVENYNIPILATEYEGENYVGMVSGTDGLLERMLRKAPPKLMALINSPLLTNRPYFGVSPSIFRKLEAEYLAANPNIPDTFYYRITGKLYDSFGVEVGDTLAGVLKYKNIWVVRMDQWSQFDAIVGSITHRCTLFTPGVIGVAYDVRPTNQYDGLGLRLKQNLDPGPDNGKIFMDTYLRHGSAIVDIDFILNASVSLFPTI